MEGHDPFLLDVHQGQIDRLLGSQVIGKLDLNISRLVKAYAGSGQAVFIESNRFKTIVSLPQEAAIPAVNIYDTIIDTINTLDDTVNDTVKQRWVRILQGIVGKPGIRMRELVDTFKVSERGILE